MPNWLRKWCRSCAWRPGSAPVCAADAVAERALAYASRVPHRRRPTMWRPNRSRNRAMTLDAVAAADGDDGGAGGAAVYQAHCCQFVAVATAGGDAAPDSGCT